MMMPTRPALLLLLLLPAIAAGQDMQWQAPKILPPKGEAVASAPSPAAPGSKPAAAKPVSSAALAQKIKDKLDEQQAAPPRPAPRRPGKADPAGTAASFMTQEEFRARLAAAMLARKQQRSGVRSGSQPSAVALAGKAGSAPVADPAHPPHWSYGGVEGPEYWGKLSPDWARCATGHRQSPIDIRDGFKLEL